MDLVVETDSGKLQGMYKNGVNVWLGIPYAQPPVGKNRFLPPQKLARWSGIRSAVSLGNACIQPGKAIMYAKEQKSEDCLYLNIWAPEKTEKLHPVLIWIHGGGFKWGSGGDPLYDGTRFALDGDIVVVTINYRLGVFGFSHLSFLGGDFSSNVGLLDQVEALRWVHDNIEAFGGDPRQVTVAGESAGGMTIGELLAMPAAKGLFQRAIMESGVVDLNPPERAQEVSSDLLAELSISRAHPEALRTVSAGQLEDAADKLRRKYDEGLFNLIFLPTVDKETLPDDPLTLVTAGKGAQVPVIIGTNREEGVLFYNGPDLPPEHIRRDLELIAGKKESERLAPDYDCSDKSYQNIITDLFFWRPSVMLASAQTAFAPVFMYRFDWHFPEGTPVYGRSVHTIEIPFAFHNLSYFDFLRKNTDANTFGEAMERASRLSDIVHGAWIRFIRSGDPASAGLSWEPYTVEKRGTLRLDDSCSMIYDPNAEKRRHVTGED